MRTSLTEQVISLAYLRLRLLTQLSAFEHERSLARRKRSWASQYYYDGVVEGITRAVNECDLALDYVEQHRKEVMNTNGN